MIFRRCVSILWQLEDGSAMLMIKREQIMLMLCYGILGVNRSEPPAKWRKAMLRKVTMPLQRCCG